MLRYIFRRTLIALPVLLAISVVVFALLNLQPGDPYVSMIDPQTSPEQKAELLARLGYSDPIWLKYVKWLGRALTGDLGYSLQYGAKVSDIIGSRLGNTALLAGSALFLTLAIAVPLGLYTGLRRNSRADIVISMVSFVVVSVPTFFLGMVLIKIFAADLRWLPTSGVVTVGAKRAGLDHVIDVGRHLVLPAVVLAASNIAIMNRYLRSSVSELLGQDFIRTLFAKGLSRRQIINPHLLRNAAKPLITIISLEIPALLSGALLTETVFSWPGIGRLNYEAVINRDYALLMGIVLFLAVITLFANLIADIVYAIVDPRVRVSK